MGHGPTRSHAHGSEQAFDRRRDCSLCWHAAWRQICVGRCCVPRGCGRRWPRRRRQSRRPSRRPRRPSSSRPTARSAMALRARARRWRRIMAFAGRGKWKHGSRLPGCRRRPSPTACRRRRCCPSRGGSRRRRSTPWRRWSDRSTRPSSRPVREENADAVDQCRAHRVRLHGQGAQQRLPAGRALLLAAADAADEGPVRAHAGEGRGGGAASSAGRRRPPTGKRSSTARTSTSSTSARRATRTPRSRSPPRARARRSSARSRWATPCRKPSACWPPSRRPA